nr:hypothetical protein [uncultured Ralstonia sp.]
MANPTKVSIETTLPADNTLETQHFEIDKQGNVIVKNKTLAEALAKKIKEGIADPTINAVKVGVVVDM